MIPPRLPILAAILALALAAPGTRSAPDLVRVATLPVAGDWRVKDTALADLDGDGDRDLLLSLGQVGGGDRRALRVHLRRDGPVAFSGEPDRELPLTRDVVAWAPADLDGKPGAEIALFTASAVYAWRWDPGEEEWPSRIAPIDFLWQIPHSRRAFHFRGGVRDLDGDGRADLAVPEPGGYRLIRRPGDGDPVVGVLRLPELAPGEEPAGKEGLRVSRRERTRELAVSLRMGGTRPGDALAVEDAVPCPVFADFDADGRQDLIARDGERLLVFRQRADGAFGESPDLSLALPVEMDRGRRLDLSFAVHGADLDGDRRMDCVILAGDRRSRELRTQVLVYRQGPEGKLFGEDGRPDQVLMVGGFAGGVYLADVDGNGLPDLVLVSVDVRAFDVLRGGGKAGLAADLQVHLNEKGAFARRPSLSLALDLPAESLSSAGESLAARFVGDVTGNGVRDLLLREEPESLALLGVRRTREGLELMPEPLFRTRIDRRAELQVLEGSPPEVLVLEPERVLHVRFR